LLIINRVSLILQVEQFLTHLACDRQLSASTQNQALHAILFFYKEVLGQPLQEVDALRAKRPVHLRHAPAPAETRALLAAVPDHGGYPTNLIARLLYGCGLRVSEPLNLRIKDVHLERRSVCIRDPKGGKDRVVAIPPSLMPELQQQIEFARAVWLRDRQNRPLEALPALTRAANPAPDRKLPPLALLVEKVQILTTINFPVTVTPIRPRFSPLFNPFLWAKAIPLNSCVKPTKSATFLLSAFSFQVSASPPSFLMSP